MLAWSLSHTQIPTCILHTSAPEASDPVQRLFDTADTGPSGPLAQSLATEIRKLARTIDADEAVRASLVQHECQCLSVALANYQRCLMEGERPQERLTDYSRCLPRLTSDLTFVAVFNRVSTGLHYENLR